MQLALRRTLYDSPGLELDVTVGVGLLQFAQRLVGLARLCEPNDHHVFLSHYNSFQSNIPDNRTLTRVDAGLNAKRRAAAAVALSPREPRPSAVGSAGKHDIASPARIARAMLARSSAGRTGAPDIEPGTRTRCEAARGARSTPLAQ